ncbi:MAG: hypothetical protein NC133_04295 [Prevotella sp.]|nr:hypothetical protein [Prevotella sp.]
MFWRKKKETPDINLIKENLVNYVFDHCLKENEDYTVVAGVGGAKLVKKVARWAYCDILKKDNIQALFSIETDKGVFCFQLQDEKLNLVPNGISELLHPELLPK